MIVMSTNTNARSAQLCDPTQTHEAQEANKVPVYCGNDTRIAFCCWHIYSTVSVWTIVRPEYSTWTPTEQQQRHTLTSPVNIQYPIAPKTTRQ